MSKMFSKEHSNINIVEHRIEMHRKLQIKDNTLDDYFCVIYLDMCDTCVIDMTTRCNDSGHISETKALKGIKIHALSLPAVHFSSH